MSNLPVFTDTVVQSFFVEAQGGAQHPISYLDRFPDTVYTKSIDSVLIKFMYALLGPVGVGQLRKEYLEARLAFEDAGLSAADLDTLYTLPFAFARLAEETYDFDADAALLTSAERARILASDASFRNRAMTYFKGIRAGGTNLGLTLIATSGLNRPVELIENYKALWDQYADIKLGIPYMGRTVDANEVIVIPRQDIPRNSMQKLTVSGDPVAGWFTLVMPGGRTDTVAQNYNVVKMTFATGSAVVGVPDASLIPPGVYVSVGPAVSGIHISGPGGIEPTYFAMSGAAQTPTSIELEYPPTSSSTGAIVTGLNGDHWAYVGSAESVPIAYNTSTIALQNALQALPSIGHNNVRVTGGPLPSQPVEIQFCNTLGDQPIATLQPNTDPYPHHINGIGGPSAIPPLVSQLVDIDNDGVTAPITIDVAVAGASADSQTAALNPRDEHAMQIGLDNVRPQTSFFTTAPGPGITQRQPVKNVFAGSAYTEVLRYETGKASTVWPSDATHWIKGGMEKEAPKPVNTKQQHYQGFHNIVDVTAYTEGALIDWGYEDGTTDLMSYWDTQIGNFSLFQVALYPFLGHFMNPGLDTFAAKQCVADTPEPLIITQGVGGTNVINDVYPTDYMGLAGRLSPRKQHFWASMERVPVFGEWPTMDYLEINLGHVQPVNYIYFEATRKPFSIYVDYDLEDQSPARRFVPIQLVDPPGSHSIMNLSYEPITNPWTTVEIHCGTQRQQMIYTRYLRLAFLRTPAGSPFAPVNKALVPYSIEIRNLRVGRNVV